MLLIGQIKNTKKENSAVCSVTAKLCWHNFDDFYIVDRKQVVDRRLTERRYSFIHATQPAGYCILDYR